LDLRCTTAHQPHAVVSLEPRRWPGLVLPPAIVALGSCPDLRDLLRAASPASPHQELAVEIIRCCGYVIDALRTTSSGPNQDGGRKIVEVELEDAVKFVE